ncbi:MAG TPA: hypothetical protein VN626_10000 [Clostridia bacterium]|nr:hypothetical protein [Clostridia bacterium]
MTHTRIKNKQPQPEKLLSAADTCGKTTRTSAPTVKPTAKEIIALKKQFLGQYADNEREIRRLEEEICRWESRAEKMTSSFSHAPSHRGEDRIQSAVDEMVELRGLLYERLVDATELRRQIARAISTVSEQRLRLLLEYRYIDSLTWEQVSAALTCDYRWTLRLHDRALAAILGPSCKSGICNF